MATTCTYVIADGRRASWRTARDITIRYRLVHTVNGTGLAHLVTPREEAETTSSVSQPILSSMPGNTAAMAIARSPTFCARRAGSSTTSGARIWQREGLKVPV
jgi:hypothetical protein